VPGLKLENFPRRLSENTILKRVTPDGYQKIFKLF